MEENQQTSFKYRNFASQHGQLFHQTDAREATLGGNNYEIS